MKLEPIHSLMSISGHPIHPMLIHFPVAMLVAVIATDFAWLVTADSFWARAGVWLTGAGAAGVWISGLIGLIDLVCVSRIRRLTTAWTHAVLAVMVLSLASLNWLLRIDDAQANIIPWGLYVSLLTGGMISLTSFLGGRLVFEFAVGIDLKGAAGRHHPRI